MNSGARRILGVVGAIRVVWDIIGATILLLVVVVGLGLGIRAGWRSIRSSPGPVSPLDTTAWGAAFNREFEQSLRMRWQPYLYWRRYPMSGQFVNVDSGGYRRTVVPWPPTPVQGTVLFLGGSTMWGTGHRDSHTIPSLVGQGLAEAGRTGLDLRNLGESGYVFTQEVIQLALALRDGARPDLVVFYDGINDVAAGVMEGRGGLPQNETRRALEFSIGRLLSRPGLPAVREVLSKASDRARGAGRFDPTPILTSDSAATALAVSIVDSYARTAELVETLATRYGFRVLYVWQPAPGGSRKPLTPFEQAFFAGDPATKGFTQYLAPVGRAAAGLVDSALGGRFPGRFLNLTGVFDRDSATVWLDEVGHVTEAGNAQIATAMVPAILTLLGPPK